MARSQYVYVVQEHENGHIAMTFTVKHELMAWIGHRMAGAHPLSHEDEVWRLRDGIEGGSVLVGDIGSITQAGDGT